MPKIYIPKELYEEIAEFAEKRGKTVNQTVEYLLADHFPRVSEI
jgi:hypothetical protein